MAWDNPNFEAKAAGLIGHQRLRANVGDRARGPVCRRKRLCRRDPVLHWDVLVPDSRIKTKVRHGRVTLEGEVSRPIQRQAAFDAVRHLAGVEAVDDEIVVRPPAGVACASAA